MIKHPHPGIACLAILLMVGSTGLFASGVLNFPAPQYMLPMYDNYTQNYLNCIAVGRGFTVMAAPGTIENAVNNPATLVSDNSFAYLEFIVKPPISEIALSAPR